MAGAFKGSANTSYYLYNENISNDYWHTMTPIGYNYYWNGASNFISNSSSSLKAGLISNSQHFGIRPVINLKSDTLVKSGDGTIDNPYIIK